MPQNSLNSRIAFLLEELRKFRSYIPPIDTPENMRTFQRISATMGWLEGLCQ